MEKSTMSVKDLARQMGISLPKAYENANQVTDQATYAERYNSLVERYEKLQAEYDALQQQKERRQIQAEAVSSCLAALEALDLLDISFSDGLWNTVVDHVTIYSNGTIVFHFKAGNNISVVN